jgi:hypothetical protein
MTDFTEYEIQIIHKVLSDELYRTSIGFENFDYATNPETAAKVATMYAIVHRIEEKHE